MDGHLVDVGCGYGRVAHALLRAGGFRGRYLGLDILPRQIAWCQENFTPLSEGSLRFELVDIKNDRYNPAGRLSPRSVSFDVETGSADVVLLASVFTHMYADDIVHYLGEIRRMLRPEGRCLATADAPRPDLILLDLNLPRVSGREVLAEIKSDQNLRRIPVVVLTTATADEDITQSYDLNANCYINKPVDMTQFVKVVQSIEDFWFTVVTLSPQ